MYSLRLILVAFILLTTTQCNTKKSSTEDSGSGTSQILYDTFLYVSNSYTNSIEIFRVTDTAGVPIFEKIDTYVAAEFSALMKSSGAGDRLYVGYPAQNTQQSLSVNRSTGALSSPVTRTLATNLKAIEISPDESLFFIQETGLLRSYGIDTDSSLIQIDAESPNGNILAHHPTKSIIYSLTTAGAGEIESTFYDGLGSQFEGQTVSTGGFSATSFSIEAKGRLVFVAHQAGPLESYLVDDNGVLSLAGTLSVEAHQVASHPTLDVLYTVSNSTSSVRSFEFDRSNGAMTEIGTPVSFSGHAMPIKIAPSGQFLLIPNNSGNSISVFNVDSVTGAVTAPASSSVPTEANPSYTEFVRILKN